MDKDELKKRLTPLQYTVTQQGGTEPAYDNLYNKHFQNGVYQCIVCGEALFDSKSKEHSTTGWPSFVDEANPGIVREVDDGPLKKKFFEVRCNKCDAHLGHRFQDKKKPSGKRYCINSASLCFKDR